jgi:hypothetical protein
VNLILFILLGEIFISFIFNFIKISSCYLFGFFLGWDWGLNLGFMLAKQALSRMSRSAKPCFVMGFFVIVPCRLFAWSKLGTMTLLILAY